MSAPVSIPNAIPNRLSESEELVSFSPSNLSSSTLNRIDSEDHKGTPLQTSWTFWIEKTQRNSSVAEYKANLRKIYTVSTVQGFWSVYDNIPTVNCILFRHYYHLMKYERQPLWEDPYLSKGGNWRLRTPKRDSAEVWKELLLAAIGEQFMDVMADGDEICGLSISPREKDDLVLIWNKDSKFRTVSRVMDKVHELLPHVNFLSEYYKSFETHSAFEGTSK